MCSPRVPGRPAADRITASPFLASSGGVVLPVIQLTRRRPRMTARGRSTSRSSRACPRLIEEQQDKNDIGPGQRIEVKLIDAPESALTSPRKKTAAILVLFMCLLGTVAVCHLLEGLRPRVEEPVDELVDWDVPLGEPAEPVDPDDDTATPRPTIAREFEVSGRRRR